jgi:predicted RNA-binding Zn-ribbon protein involved in translation (DUF1610 family)
MTIIREDYPEWECLVICECGERFSDWSFVTHECPACGAVDMGS